MKIDMLPMTVNNSLNNDNKIQKIKVEFLDILENEVDNISFKDSQDEEIEIKDELLQVICSLINSLNLNNDFNSEKIEKIDSSIEGINLENLSELDTKLNDMNLSNSEINYINNKLEDIINRTVENFTKEIEEIDKSSSFIKNNNNTENKLIQAIKNSLENDSNKEGNDNKLEKLINNNFNKIQYVEDSYLDKEKNILLRISESGGDNRLPTKDRDFSNNELNILNNISTFENNLSKAIEDAKPIEIRSDYVVEDIEQAIKYIKNNGVEDLTLKINPKELGELTIKLIKNKGENKVVITSSSSETFKLINENIKEIENHLINLDIKINQVSIEVKNYVQNDFLGDLNQQFNSRNDSKEERRSTFIKKENLDEEIEEKYQDGNIDLLI